MGHRSSPFAPRQCIRARGLALGGALLLLVARPSLAQEGPHPASAPASAPADAAAASAPASPAAKIARARRRILEGRYDDARQLLDDALAAKPDLALRAALVRSDLDERVGGYRDSIERLKSLETAGRDNADWRTALAVQLAAVGEYETAIEHLQAALKANARHYRARCELARLQELLARTDDAIATLRPFEAEMKTRLPDRADDLVWLGRGFLRISTLTKHPEIKNRSKHVLQEVFQEAIEFVDSGYWPARQAAGELLQEKHNNTEAAEEFAGVLAINAQCAEAYVGLARAALENWDFEQVETRAGEALDVNSNCVAAHVALGECRMLERRWSDAAKCCESALAINPRSIEALCVLAAAKRRSGDAAAEQRTAELLTALCPKPAALHHTLGKWLSAGRQYDEGEAEFRRAIDLAPWWSEPRTELGLMLMQSGNEPGARDVLEQSWKLDPYNQQTYNTLELLDELEKYARRETPHFTFSFEADADAILVPYLAAHMEKLHAELTQKFATPLDRKTTIEVFPRHDNFSVRIAGRPWIATVGACTGPVIAWSAPRPGASPTPFNWAEVLRHEFTHTVTLAATANRIPHWMTEGLAVHEETAAKGWSARELLSAAARLGRLFTLDTIDWGFQRPRRPTDRQLAYAQSELMIEFIVEHWGFDAVHRLLAAFKDRRTQPEAFAEVLKTSPEAFAERFTPWATQQIQSWGLPTDALPTIAGLAAKADAEGGDAATEAKMAEIALYDGDIEKAEKLARGALELDEREPLALQLLATLACEQAEHPPREIEPEAVEKFAADADDLVRRLLAIQPDNIEGVRCAAILAQRRGDFDAALRHWETYRARRPDDPLAIKRTAGIRLRQSKPDEALLLLEQAWRVEDSDRSVPRQIAELYRARRDYAAATTWYRRVMDIDPYDPDMQAALGDCAQIAGDLPTAELAWQSVCALRPEDAAAHDRLSNVYHGLGRKALARECRRKCEKLGGVAGGEWYPLPRPPEGEGTDAAED